MAVYRKKYVTGDPTSWTWVTNTTNLNSWRGTIIAVRGAIGVDLNMTQATTSGSFINWVGMTPKSAEGLTLYLGQSQSSEWQSRATIWPQAVPAGTTIVPIAGTTTTNNQGIGAAYIAHTTAAAITSKACATFEPATASMPHRSWILDFYAPLTLNALNLSSSTVRDNVPVGGVAVSVQGHTSGSTLALTRDDSNSLVLDSNGDLKVKPGGSEWFVGGVYGLEVTETLADATNSPRVSSFSFEVVEGFRGPPWKTVGSFNSSTATMSLVPPSGILATDFVMAFIETANQAVTAPTGWSEAPFSPVTIGGAGTTTATRLSVFYRSGTASLGAQTWADPGDHIAGIIHTFENVDLADPFGEYATDPTSTSSTNVVFPTLNTQKNRLLVTAVTVATDIATARVNTWTNNQIERSDNATTQGNGGGVAVATKEIMTTGSTGSLGATLATASVQCRASFTLKPAGDTPPTPIAFVGFSYWLM